jgi:hypothetical protein
VLKHGLLRSRVNKLGCQSDHVPVITKESAASLELAPGRPVCTVVESSHTAVARVVFGHDPIQAAVVSPPASEGYLITRFLIGTAGFPA